MNNVNWQVEHERFMTSVYPRIVKAATHAFWHWKSNKRPDAIQEAVSKVWDSFIRIRLRNRDPEPLLAGIIKYAILWVRYDRRIAGRSRMPDVFDYRSGFKQQQFSDDGGACPSDRGDAENAWIDWNVQTGDDPCALASALEQTGTSLAQFCDL
jgi:hypothetical protein